MECVCKRLTHSNYRGSRSKDLEGDLAAGGPEEPVV